MGKNVQEKLLKFKADGRKFSNFLRSQEQFIQTVKGQNNFWFLTSSWRLLIHTKFEKLKSKLEKIIGIQKHAGKVRKQPF